MSTIATPDTDGTRLNMDDIILHNQQTFGKADQNQSEIQSCESEIEKVPVGGNSNSNQQQLLNQTVKMEGVCSVASNSTPHQSTESNETDIQSYSYSHDGLAQNLDSNLVPTLDPTPDTTTTSITPHAHYYTDASDTAIQENMDMGSQPELKLSLSKQLTEQNDHKPNIANDVMNFDEAKTTCWEVVPENSGSSTEAKFHSIVAEDKVNVSVTTSDHSNDDLITPNVNKNNPSDSVVTSMVSTDENVKTASSDHIVNDTSTSSGNSSFMCVDVVSKEFDKSHTENYLRGCKWSPDGTEVLTNSNDNVLRTFSPTGQGGHTGQQMTPNCTMKQSGIVYDFAWFPGKTDSKPESCRVACSCPGNPIHLWDSNQGHIVSSYRAFDHCDELTSAYSLSFSPDGSKLYGGYKNSIRIFDTEYSHRACTTIKTMDPKTKEGHKGIISCFCHGTLESNTFVTGSYSRHVGVYYTLANKLVCLIQGQQGGVTHIALSPDGRRLYTGGRKDPEILCWDMRNFGQVYCTYLRDVQTNQRIYFDLSPSGRYLVSGNHDGSLQAWDTTQPGEEMNGERIVRPCHAFQAHADCVNGVSFHPQGVMLATASGQRHFGQVMSDDSDDEKDDNNVDVKDVKDYSMKIWSTPWF